MKKTETSLSVLLAGAILLLASLAMVRCIPEPTYSTVPQIHFERISRYTLQAGAGVGQARRDSLVITIGFTDGDGDLGDLLPLSSESVAHYQQAGGWSNYKIRTFRLMNKQFQEDTFKVNSFLTLPALRRDDKVGPILGDLQFSQTYLYGTRYTLYPTKFRIQIRDRALNVSNEVETDTINVPFSY